MIFFSLDTTTWTAMSARARMPAASYTGLSLPPLPILKSLGITSPHAGVRVSVEAVDENLAFVGPPGSTGVTIVANAGRVIKLSKS